MFGQFGHFVNLSEKHPYAIERYTNETRRLLGVLEKQLATTGAFVAGAEYSLADIALYPWLKLFKDRHTARMGFNEETYPNILRWMKVVAERPGVQRGMALLP